MKVIFLQLSSKGVIGLFHQSILAKLLKTQLVTCQVIVWRFEKEKTLPKIKQASNWLKTKAAVHLKTWYVKWDFTGCKGGEKGEGGEL